MLPAWLDDVVVEVGEVPGALSGETASGVLWSAAPQLFRLEVPSVARFLAAGGRSLTIWPDPGADRDAVARFARSTPLAALCYQRGLTVLHAAVAARDGRAVALAGASVAGKSTLVAALVRRGWAMLSDDLAPLGLGEDGQPIVHPISADPVLWPDARARLASLGVPVTETAPVTAALPLGQIWWLSVDNEAELRIEELQGLESFDGLGSLVYNRRVAHALLDRVQYMRTAAAVASAVPIRRAHRPRGRWTVEQLADAVESAAPQP